MRRMEPTVRDVLLGAALYGVLVEGIGLLLVSNKLSYSLGILTGYLCVVFLTIHMYLTLEKVLDMDAKSATRKNLGYSILRYVIIFGVLVLVIHIPQISVVSVIIMLFGLKIVASLQPYIRKYITSKLFREDA